MINVLYNKKFISMIKKLRNSILNSLKMIFAKKTNFNTYFIFINNKIIRIKNNLN